MLDRIIIIHDIRKGFRGKHKHAHFIFEILKVLIDKLKNWCRDTAYIDNASISTLCVSRDSLSCAPRMNR